MTRHVGMAIALNVPLFVVVTKVRAWLYMPSSLSLSLHTSSHLSALTSTNPTSTSITSLPGRPLPEPVIGDDEATLPATQTPGARKQPYAVRSVDELMLAVRGFGKSAITRSSRSRVSTALTSRCYDRSSTCSRQGARGSLRTSCPRILIDQFFNVGGVGLVVAGTLLWRRLLNHTLLMGPNNQGRFNSVTVEHTPHATSGPCSPARANRRLRRRSREAREAVWYKKGDGLPRCEPRAVRDKVFTCDVLVLHSQTTMRVNYQPILYARNVRQCVRIVEMAKEVLRTGEHSSSNSLCAFSRHLPSHNPPPSFLYTPRK